MPKLSELPPATAAQVQHLVAVQGTAAAYDDVLLPLDASLGAGTESLAVAFGTAAGTAAAGDGPRIEGALQSESNLSDLLRPKAPVII